MKALKRLTSVILPVAIITGSSAIGATNTLKADAAEQSERYSIIMSEWDTRISEQSNRFVNGKYWNHIFKANWTEKTVTDFSCDHSQYGHTYCNSIEYFPSYKCNGGISKYWELSSENNASTIDQCYGFSRKIAQEVWKTNFFHKIDSVGSTELRVGDQVRLEFNVKDAWGSGSVEHSIFITGISGDNITFADCNASLNDCKIRWGATEYYDTFKRENNSNVGDHVTTVTKDFIKKYGKYIERPYIIGDINADDKIDNEDVKLFESTYFDDASFYNSHFTYDVNKDGKINLDDYSQLKTYANSAYIDGYVATLDDLNNNHPTFNKQSVPDGCFVYNDGIYKSQGNSATFIKPLYNDVKEFVIEPSVIKYHDRIYNVTAIGDNNTQPTGNFFGTIESVVIPSSVKTIKKFAFSNSNLSSIKFDGSNPELVKIEEGAFYGCSNLSYINLKNCKNLEIIGNNAFGSCNYSKGITISYPSKKLYLGSYSSRLGDANADGKVNNTDTACIRDYINKRNTNNKIVNQANVDLNFDGKIDITDMSLLDNLLGY